MCEKHSLLSVTCRITLLVSACPHPDLFLTPNPCLGTPRLSLPSYAELFLNHRTSSCGSAFLSPVSDPCTQSQSRSTRHLSNGISLIWLTVMLEFANLSTITGRQLTEPNGLSIEPFGLRDVTTCMLRIASSLRKISLRTGFRAKRHYLIHTQFKCLHSGSNR